MRPFRRVAWLDRLLAAIEAGRVSPGELDTALQQRLLGGTDAGLRDPAREDLEACLRLRPGDAEAARLLAGLGS